MKVAQVASMEQHGGAMKKPDPNATIQLDRVDRLDDIQLDDPDSPAPPIRSTRPGVSAGPPPLPPSASHPPAQTIPSYSVAPYAGPMNPTHAPVPSRKGRSVVQGVLFVALLGAAVIGGLKVGGWFRAPAPVAKIAPTVVVAEPAASPPPAPSAQAAPAVLTMPTVEMNDTPAESK